MCSLRTIKVYMMYMITAFMSVASGKPFHIPVEIDVQCVKSAEAIVNTSYSHAEVFTSVSINHVIKSIRCVVSVTLSECHSIHFISQYNYLCAMRLVCNTVI